MAEAQSGLKGQFGAISWGMVAGLLVALVAVLVVAALLAKTTTKPATSVKTYNLTVNNHKITAGPTTIRVARGDKIVLQATTDDAQENDIVVKGYDQKTTLEKGSLAQLPITAGQAGSFDIVLRIEPETTSQAQEIVLGRIEVK